MFEIEYILHGELFSVNILYFEKHIPNLFKY